MTASTARPRLSTVRLLAAVVLLAFCGLAQQAGKRPLTHKDYDNWRSIQTQALSRDGKYLAYAVFPQEGDGEAIVRDLATGKERREAAGAAPPAAPPSAEPTGEEEQTPRSVNLAFTADNRFLISSTFPSRADTDKAKKEKKRPEEMPKGGIVIIDLKSDGVTRISGVKSYQVPANGGDWIACLKEATPAVKPPEKSEANRLETGDWRPEARTGVVFLQPPASSLQPRNKDQARGGSRPGGSLAARKAEYGTELVLRDLTKTEQNERTFPDVTEYLLSKDGKALVYAVSSRKPESNGVYAMAPGSDRTPAALLSGKGKYSRLTWDVKQSQLAFLSGRDDAEAKQPKLKLYLWDRKAPAAAEIVSTATAGFRSDYVISDRGSLSFSRDGSRLFFGCAPPSPPEIEKEAEAAPSDDKVMADLWHWKDPFIQPMQKVRATRDRDRSFRAVYHIAAKKTVQLADPVMEEITPTDDGRYAIGSDDRAYRSMVDYDTRYADYYLVDTATGERKPLVKKVRGAMSSGRGRGSSESRNPISPDGRYFLFFDNKHWQTIRIPDGAITNLTATRDVNFYNELDDTPGEPSSYGTAGWTSDGKSVLLYDRYDVWQISPDGKSARNVTQGYGRREKLQFRVLRMEAETEAEAGAEREEQSRGVDPAKPILLRAENERTRDTGFWRSALKDDAPPQKLLMAAKSFRPITKAKDADVVVLTASTFNEFPDLLVTDSGFRQLRKVSDANPQKAQLLWGSGELIGYKNADGVPLQAALYKPENFDPKKKYPMMVYLYERLSQNVNAFVPPRPGHSINISYYASNGYLVLTPDIVYTVGHPGQSALKCVLPAIQAVADQGFLDENAIGIQGHSWGGYQTAYLVTQTTRFRAASAGAPVANMTSAYDGIRWGTGLPRQFQYEKTQSRIGATLWQAPMLFLENSPVFMVDRVRTPLLILHNDADDAVPWYQGIELYLSLRRLGKEAYFFSYNGEPHGLRKRVNQKDYTVRLQQFFDHFLKGAPTPEWMEKGIPYLEREQEKEKLK